MTAADKSIWRLSVVALLLPVAAWSLALVVTREAKINIAELDFAMLAASVLLGLVCIGLMPLSSLRRLLLAAVYAPAAAIALVFYGFEFIGIVYGNWL